MNSSKFTDEEVRAVYDACADSGIDYMEIGYVTHKKIVLGEYAECYIQALKQYTAGKGN